MNVSSKTAGGLVLASAALSPDASSGLASVALGLLGVALARQVFISKERRRTGERQPWTETLPLTLVAMLITGVIVWDRRYGLSISVFIGLGVGWTAILLLDVLGAWVLRTLRRVAGVTDADIPLPAEHRELVRRLDEATTHEKPKES